MEVNPVFSGRNFRVDSKLCFVLLPLHDPFLSIFELHIKPAAAKCGLQAIKANDILSNKPVMEDVWNHINKARIVVADLTHYNPNVFYELGIAHTLGKEVIMITQDEAKVPFDVGHVRYITYVFPSQAQAFQNKLEETISQVLKDSTVEVRPIESETRRPRETTSPLTVRNKRLKDLTEYAREWAEKNYLGLVEKRDGYGNYSEWDVFEKIGNEIRTEAVRRWSPSGGTAKNYSDAVMLTVESEFKERVSLEVKRKEDERQRKIKEERERRTLLKSIYVPLEDSRQLVGAGRYVEALVRTGKFTEEQAAKEVNRLIKEDALTVIGKNTLQRGYNFDRFGRYSNF